MTRIPPAAAYREYRRRLAARAAAAGAALSFRAFAESPDFCGLTLSPLMAAIADAADGTPVSLDDEACVRHFGCAASALPRERPRTVVARTGGRGGKTSRMVAPKALHAAWTAELPTLASGEVAVALIVAPDLKLARQALGFARGYVERSPALSGSLVKEPTTDAIDLRRPDGKLVRVEVLAASRGGRAVRARTLVFASMDEAAFFFAEGTGVVNDTDIRNAAEQRIVPGGQLWITSTPWLADVGELETTIAKNWGTHRDALVVWSGTRELNPTWDPTGEIERKLRDRDPDAARREVDGLPLSGGASRFFDPADIERAVAAGRAMGLTLPRLPLPSEEVTAGGDLGFIRDAAALAIVHRQPSRIILADLEERRPSEGQPLKPSETVRGFAERMLAHAGLEYLTADGHYAATVYEVFAEVSSSRPSRHLGYKRAPADVSEPYVRTRTLLREGRLVLPYHERLIAQLKAVQGRPTQGGGISILLPQERIGGHCDLVSALVLALYEARGLEVDAPPPKAGTAEYLDDIERADIEAIERRGRAWWES